MTNEEYIKFFKENKSSNNKFHVRTYGCQMNEHDSEQVEFIMSTLGMKKTDDYTDADYIIINTCAVRATAENKVNGFLGILKHEKEKNKDFKIVVSGCLPNAEKDLDEFLRLNNHIDILMGTANYNKLPELLYNSLYYKKTIVDISDQYDVESMDLNYNRMYNHKAFVNIMYGCNNFCTYCIVPYTRGREVSRKLDDVVDEITKLSANGVKEVTLLVQYVNSYCKTLDGNVDFSMLLKEINKIDGIKRIRFMTSHPRDISDEVINSYKTLENLSKHLHLPVQSGSNKVLKEMNRHYTREDYLSKINKIKEISSDIALTTDIIVGFPGETEEDFLDTLDLVNEVGFDSVFTFIFSQREGTKAAYREDQIPHDIKMERFNRLLDAVNKNALEKNLKYIGKSVLVLVDEISKTDENMLSGKTDTFKTVNFKGDKELIGDIVKVKITDANTFSLQGIIDE